MADKNLPNIPIYIGDWERDCNVLSLQAEMAWMKIIFKMHLSGKQSRYKVSAKGLQRLWKSNANEVQEIIQELQFEEIGEITEIKGGYEFFSRRLEKENNISEVRSKAAKNRWNKDSSNANLKQTKSKKVQNTDIDNDNDIENESKNEKGGAGGKKKTSEIEVVDHEVVFPFETETFKTQWQHWKIYKKKEFGFRFKSLQSEQAALTELNNKATGNEKTAIKIIHQSMSNGWKGFFELKNNENGNRNNNQTRSDQELKQSASEAVDRMFSGQ